MDNAVITHKVQSAYASYENELEFAIFCIENVAKAASISTQDLMDKITIQSDILNNYIVANYDVLHTQGKQYIVDDIIDTIKERGIDI